ncbi:MAG: flagellar basal-body MS-ring/collar protein FliF [Rhodospirillales bacterium]
MQNLLQTLKGLGTLRLLAMAGVAVGLIAFFVFLTARFDNTNMALLYGDLDASDSSRIVSKLEAQKIPYELRDGGRMIMVPGDRALRLRMAMAEEGLPRGGSIGYEIFDKGDGLGTTNFMQNVNLVRALEGELSRTIRAINSVEEARVHVVLPKRELFSRQQPEPSASVVIKTRGRDRLEKTQVLSIQHLVAAAVPQLKPSRVSVIDAMGRLLARGEASDNPADYAALNNEEVRRGHEQRLQRMVETLLEQSVGVGRVRAEVTAEMDFDRITTSAESYDPNGQVVRSTQTVEENARNAESSSERTVSVANNLPDNNANANGNGAGGSNSQSNRTEETVNYEISKTVRSHVREAGTVRRLSIGVLVDGNYELVDGKPVYAPRDQAELEKLTGLVKSAVGFDAKRGDTVEVVNLRFATIDEASLKTPEPVFGLNKADYFRIAEMFVLAVVGVLVILLVVRPVVARMLSALPNALEEEKAQALLADQSIEPAQLTGPSSTGIPGGGGGAAGDDESIDISRVEGKVKASTIKKILEIVDRHPEETVSIIRQWMYQET